MRAFKNAFYKRFFGISIVTLNTCVCQHSIRHNLRKIMKSFDTPPNRLFLCIWTVFHNLVIQDVAIGRDAFIYLYFHNYIVCYFNHGDIWSSCIDVMPLNFLYMNISSDMLKLLKLVMTFTKLTFHMSIFLSWVLNPLLMKPTN